MCNDIPQGDVALPLGLMRNPVFLAQVLHGNDDVIFHNKVISDLNAVVGQPAIGLNVDTS